MAVVVAIVIPILFINANVITWNGFWQALGAIGSIVVAVTAVWGDYIRKRLFAPKLLLEQYNTRGNLTFRANGQKVIFYHLRVVNSGLTSATNCKVLLTKLFRRDASGTYQQVPLIIPQQFIWSPAEFSPVLATIVKHGIVDLGFIDENSNHFMPALYYVSNNFRGMVGSNDSFRYVIQVEADNYGLSDNYVYEISWNGQWSDDLDIMSGNLSITEITQASR